MGWLLVFLGGGLGSLSRYGIALALPTTDLSEGELPWATLLANVIACLLLGLGLALFSRGVLSKELSLLLLTGFCGGFSTFSTFSAEAFGLYEGGHWVAAGVYLLVSLLAGVLAVMGGLYLLR
ncbi:fluoride efflux transporter CrcB [Neolewinella antarctica]|uniref:Fluoride-specific ion channel FluC n=1 Tax=Neolewinella antarctica TaxID=442734 RepID=A0ABX0XEQ5_9BACT|nr:fluoride efflux transporter CrcB [Neolewinella antarctica]NJC27803.1 CrcB protein [Neolewinella antarctica]